nr:PREDICTED: molybdopterin synthase sulfur carrier subunit [Apteryx mantelli mantelli]
MYDVLEVYWKQNCVSLRSIDLSCPRLCTSLLFKEISWLNANTLFRNLFVLLPIPLRLAVIRDQVVFAVQQEYVLLGDQLLVLHPGDEVAIIPPISGG